MGRTKAAKERRHAKAMAKRRAKKAAKRAEYEARIAAGRNKKPKRAQRAGRTVKPEKVEIAVVIPFRGREMRRVHGGPACRNVGCLRCSPTRAKERAA